MKPYPKYKDSGVEWIGDIPVDWTTIQIKRLSLVKRGASPRPIADPKYFDDNGEYAWVRIADVSVSNRYLVNTTQQLSEVGSSLSVKQFPGDLFLSIAGTVGKPIITKIKCCIHDGFVYFPNLKVNPEYLYYVFSTGEPYKGLGKWGTQLNLNTETVGYIPISLPPNKHEISGIVRHLDAKTAQIDDLISKKQKLIELLKEERAAIINQAVTKGLNPDAPMKDSGIEWLGEVPGHWEVKRLKYFFKLITEKDYSLQTKKVALENIESWTGRFIDSEVDYQGEGISFLEGDVLFGKLRPYLAKVLNAKFSGASVGDIFVMRPKLGISSRFAFYRFLSELFIDIVNGSTFGAKMPRVSWDFIANLHIAMPNNNEQRTISDHLGRKTTTIDQTKLRIEKQINLLKEFRTALISEAVTGKIDVRDEELK